MEQRNIDNLPCFWHFLGFLRWNSIRGKSGTQSVLLVFQCSVVHKINQVDSKRTVSMGINFSYPWDKWFDGQLRFLDPLVDVNKNLRTFKVCLRRQLSARSCHAGFKEIDYHGRRKIQFQTWSVCEDAPEWVDKKSIVRCP